MSPASINTAKAKGKGEQVVSTPLKLVHELEHLVGGSFTLDPCASAGNAKAPTYFTEETNGLLQPWTGHTVFCNPPYRDIEPWISKAEREAEETNGITLLLPVSTDTRWFHNHARGAQILFIQGRVAFQDIQPPFNNMVLFMNCRPIPNTWRHSGLYQNPDATKV